MTLPRILNDTVLHSSTVLNPSADISKTQFLVATQGTYDVYSRTVTTSNVRLASVAAKSFWATLDGPVAAGLCATSPQGEPSVAYDWNADRWVVSEAAYAVDQSNNPTGP